MADPASDTIRIDKWLWHARFFKTRGLATKVVQAGKVRVDGAPISKPSRNVGPGVVLTFAQGRDVRVVKIIAIGTRRGPASEAQALYDDLVPVERPKPEQIPHNPGRDRTGRPTKKDRRAIRALEGPENGA